MSQSCPNNGRFPTSTEPIYALLALLCIVKTLDPNQLQTVIAMGELAGFVGLFFGLRGRS